MDSIDCLVIGGGVLGIACARALALAGREVVITESNARIGEESSARNNEVIHAGFLYAPGTLKERLCGPGGARLYAYCEERGIAHARIGKIMPAVTAAQYRLLQAFKSRADALGIAVELLDERDARALEPELRCIGALHSPATGIVDSHALMLSLLGDAEARGAVLVANSRVDGLAPGKGGSIVAQTVSADGHRAGFECASVVNAAGLDAERLARTFGGKAAAVAPKVYFAKGSYYTYRGRAPFRHLIAPVAETLAGGGAFTLDLAGQGRFGPDLEWVDTRDYTVEPGMAEKFANAIRSYWPGVEGSRLEPGYAGIRARTTGPGEPLTDWCIQGPVDHGVANLINMFAMESPGLTSSLAIADHVAARLTTDTLIHSGNTL